ncbi:MAG: hypothetical protein M1480_14945 [Bacteroidetes bacterium]|nr:hypothetical protein [Bacteroidota bacterium]
MLNSIKQKIAGYIVNKKIKQKKIEKQSFTFLLKNSTRFFILMPDNEVHFHHAVDIVKYFEALDKDITVFTRDFRVNLLPIKYRNSSISFGIENITKLNLPTNELENKLKEFEFDLVLDLNKEENLFYSLTANLVRSQVRVGFRKNNSDKYYNLQVDNLEDNPEIFYKNLLNCLQMF